MSSRQHSLGHPKRVVVKFGTGLLTDRQNRLAPDRIAQLIAQLAGLRGDRRQLTVVSSGAIGAGMSVLGMSQRPKLLPQLQAAAAVGQSKLMAVYDAGFAPHSLNVAQVLLTHDDLRNRARHLNARNTLITLLDQGVVPIINENDTVSVDEIRFGDNDTLSALTATLIDADLLIILSHVEGLLKDGAAIPQVDQITPARAARRVHRQLGEHGLLRRPSPALRRAAQRRPQERSLPVTFAGPGGASVVPRSGRALTAY